MNPFINKENNETLITIEPIYTDKYHYEGVLSTAVDIARHHGFFLIEPIKKLQKLGNLSNHLTFHEKNTVFKHLTNPENIQKSKRYHVKPTMICHCKAHLSGTDKKNKSEFHLNIFDEEKSIAEATIIKVLCAILNEYGYKNIIIILNSLGDKISRNNFTKDLKSYYRKKVEIICSNCKSKFEKDVFRLLECNGKKCVEIKENAPKSISYLEEYSRKHFKQILEYLESINMPYIIENNLVGNVNGGSRIIFQICEITPDGNSRKVLAKGERSFGYTQNNKLNKTSFLHASVLINFNKNICKKKCITYTKKEKYITLSLIPQKRMPKIYFVQLGFEARLTGLNIIEDLRKNNISIYQSLAENGLSSQISEANFLSVPFIIIMGSREVKEKTVIVRELNTYKQETVPVDKLARYIKKVVK